MAVEEPKVTKKATKKVTKKRKRVPEPEPEDEEEEEEEEAAEEEEEEEGEEGAAIFEGVTFCITGAFSMTRKKLTVLLNSHGADVASSLTKKVARARTRAPRASALMQRRVQVTHLLSASPQPGTTKHDLAVGRGLPICDEVRARSAPARCCS